MMTPLLEFRSAVHLVKQGENSVKVAESLLSELTSDERLWLIDGDSEFWKGLNDLYMGVYLKEPYVHGAVKRLGIPGIRYCDGPRGVNINTATAFPVSMARAATWDPSLEERVGIAIGLESRAYGANTVGSVCINLPRHPVWGRVQETYGEDPLLLGEFGAAQVRGLQRNVMACVKHLALNSIETTRFRVDVQIDDAALHEVYLPQFKRCVEEGAFSIMSAYNSVNGEWAGENRELLTNILRNQWGFKGFVISDWVFGLRDGVKSIKAGLDIEAPFQNRRAFSVRLALESGDLQWADINNIVRRILDSQLRFYAARVPEEPSKNVAFSPAHQDLALEVARKSIVLLKNTEVDGQPLLPLRSHLPSCAIIGRLANSTATGDRASSWVNCPDVISPYQGLKQALPNTNIVLSDADDVQSAVEAAQRCEVTLLIVGYDSGDEGEFLRPSREDDAEALALFPPLDDSPAAQRIRMVLSKSSSHGSNGLDSSETQAHFSNKTAPPEDFLSRPTGGDRHSVRLRPRDVDIIRAVVSANPRTIVSIVTAGAVITEEWRHSVPAVLVGWYNGCKGGRALADVLMGVVDPSGRLPWSMPTSEAHFPEFDPCRESVVYDKWFGQRLLDRLGVNAAFPLGYGLSYTTFQLTKAIVRKAASRDGEQLTVSVTLRNSGAKKGRCVVQVYGRPRFARGGGNDFPERVLLGFQSMEVEAQESTSIDVAVSTRPLRRWVNGKLELDANGVLLEVGQHAGDPMPLRLPHSFVKASI
ncbi:glycoside hydrolase superfamily [Leptodontidium sp. MPI-SDFR-AT-0119]|nr:glycoside hydrolase superfamily [Leptodontidium sp. MPI-SDFR-AT-0119]